MKLVDRSKIQAGFFPLYNGSACSQTKVLLSKDVHFEQEEGTHEQDKFSGRLICAA